MILIAGELAQGDEHKFGKIAADHPTAIVLLDSNGGALQPALEIGKIIKLREYTTVIYKSGTCASACALIWVAGARRAIFNGGRVGFHAAYVDTSGRPIETGLGNALVGHYLSQLGFGENAVVFATSAPPDKISWLRRDNAQSSGISFESFVSDEVASSPDPSSPATPPSNEGEALDSAARVGRTTKFFAEGLRAAGFRSEVNTTTPSSPEIITGAGGDNIVIAFSGCDVGGCKYAEIIAQWTGVNKDQANRALTAYSAEEKFASLVYSSKTQTLSVYHYIIIGTDGIAVQNLIDYIIYFDKEFQETLKFFQGSN